MLGTRDVVWKGTGRTGFDLNQFVGQARNSKLAGLRRKVWLVFLFIHSSIQKIIN